MTEPIINCPKCHTDIPLTESLAAPLLAATRSKYERKIADQAQDIAAREARMRDAQATLEKERAGIDQQVFEKMQSERGRIATEEAAKAKRNAATDLDQKIKELADLQQILSQQNEKLADAQKAQADLIRKQRELDDAKREIELTIEKRVQASLGAVREKAKLDAEEGLKLRVAEKEEQIASMQRQIDELKRKAEQGSQQLQGEAQELALEGLLRSKFPHDII
jgi:hypothetical protein